MTLKYKTGAAMREDAEDAMLENNVDVRNYTALDIIAKILHATPHSDWPVVFSTLKRARPEWFKR